MSNVLGWQESGASKKEPAAGLHTGSRCSLCPGGRLEPGTTTVFLERGGATLVFKNVPAKVCDQCGEAFTDAETTQEMFRQAEAALKEGAEVEVRRYVAA